LAAEPRVFTADPSSRVEAAFAAVAAGPMRDFPLGNPALSVEAVGFGLWRGNWLGALVTPWTIGLLLLPGGNPEFRVLQGTDSQVWRFPAGDFVFHGGSLEGLEPYQSCSLFSPPAGFDSQDVARTVASESLAALLRPGGLEANPAPTPVSRRAFLRGELHRDSP
jgi:[NiFe] hydrogenase assembly HybE family chaperone